MPRNPIIPYNPKLKARARELRKKSTLTEILLWREIKRKALGVQFHRQVPIDQFIVDFFCHELRLAIEVDGSIHFSPEARERDAARQKRLEELGVRFLRFTNTEVQRNMPGVLAVLTAAIIECS